MPSLNLKQLTSTGAMYKVVLCTADGIVFPILTGDAIDWDESRTGESIHALGQEDPIAVQSNARNFSGKFSLQLGELTQILLILGLSSATYIDNCVIAVTATTINFNKTFSGININKSSAGPKRKDTEVLAMLDFMATSIA